MINIYILIVAFCALLGGIAQLLFKVATSKGLSIEMLFDWKLILGFALYGLAFIGYLFALSKYNKVSVLYFIISLSYVVVAIGAYTILKEPITARMWLGAGFILIGVILVQG